MRIVNPLYDTAFKEWERISMELMEKEEELREEREKLREEREKSQVKDSIIENLVRTLLLSGKSKEEISILTGISVSEIEKLI